MPLKLEPDFHSGVYICNSSINELKIRVILEMVTTTALEEIGPEEDSEEKVKPIRKGSSEQMDFSWQERVYSKREIEFYKKEANCHTQAQLKYHEDVKKILSNCEAMPDNRLFSLTAEDKFCDEFDRKLMTNDNERFSTKLSTKMKAVHSACPMTIQRRQWDLFSTSASSQNIVDYNPSKEVQLRNRLIVAPSETMHIIADLSQQSGRGISEINYSDVDLQYSLVTLNWQPLTRTLIVLPDFLSKSSHVNGYSIKLSYDSMNMEYRYWVQNVSSSNYSLSHQLLSKKILSQKPLQTDRPTVESNFSVPDKNVLNCFVFIELETASNFDYDPIFILYYVHLPEGWVSTDPKSLHGTTHLSYAKNDIANFSHLLELKLMLDFALLNDEKKSKNYTAALPCLYLEVCNMDGWGRYRTLGYAHCYVPQNAGTQRITLNTWRPALSSVKEMLRDFFIGGNKQLSHISFSGIPPFFEGSLLSKYGFQTIASGCITLKMNVVHQANDSALQSSGKKPKHLMHQMSCSSLVNSVNAVLEAFQRARERMLLAKTPLLEYQVESTYRDLQDSENISSEQDNLTE